MNVRRLVDGPIVHAGLSASIGENINGPSLVAAPSWLPGRMAKYYLYFAHHGGKFIRLALADELAGPWRIYEPGTLRLEQTVFKWHIASPDVHVDERAREIRMYFHGPVEAGKQMTAVARSRDGVRFEPGDEMLGMSYFRVFEYEGWHYAMEMPGNLLRSRDGVTDFERGHAVLAKPAAMDETGQLDRSYRARHMAVRRRGDVLDIFYSRVGDELEHIVKSVMSLRGDWKDWRAGEAESVVRPERDWEGAALAIVRSVGGPVHEPVHQLRDPAIYEEAGRTYLLYSTAGESGIGIAEVVEE